MIKWLKKAKIQVRVKQKKELESEVAELQSELDKKNIPQPQQQKRSYKNIIVSIIIFLIIISIIGGALSHYSTMNNVHITDFSYYYSDPQTGRNWTYSVPFNSNVSEGSISNLSSPFTNNLTCAMTITQAYSITSGFSYQVHGLPETFNPEQTKDFNITVTYPSYTYSGPFNIKVLVTYNGNC